MRLIKRMNKFLGGFFLTSMCMGCIIPKNCLKDEDTHWMLSDTVIYKQLGPNLTDIFFSPDSVKCYYLIHKDSIRGQDTISIKGYVHDSMLAVLNKEQIGIFQYVLLSNKGSYSRDSIVKIEAPYMPIIEYVFFKNKNTSASVVLSTSDRTWSVFYEGKEFFHYNYTDSRIVERFCNYFLDMYSTQTEKK